MYPHSILTFEFESRHLGKDAFSFFILIYPLARGRAPHDSILCHPGAAFELFLAQQKTMTRAAGVVDVRTYDIALRIDPKRLRVAAAKRRRHLEDRKSALTQQKTMRGGNAAVKDRPHNVALRIDPLRHRI